VHVLLAVIELQNGGVALTARVVTITVCPCRKVKIKRGLVVWSTCTLRATVHIASLLFLCFALSVCYTVRREFSISLAQEYDLSGNVRYLQTVCLKCWNRVMRTQCA
jgi:hypothetical protein